MTSDRFGDAAGERGEREREIEDKYEQKNGLNERQLEVAFAHSCVK